MTRLLVTGGAGFIGSNFTRIARRRGYEVRVLDKLTYAGNLENLRDLLDADRIEFIRGDVCDARAVARAVRGCDSIVHFAAETHVDRSILEAGTFVRTDVYGTYVMLEAARKANVDRVLHISSDEVYGEAKGRPSREEDPLNPKSPYAASKAGADRLVYAYHETYGVPAVVTRCVNNYGPFQHPEKALPLFTICALLGHPIPVYGTGRNRREWIHVDDHCAALFAVLRHRGLEGEVFNIGTGEQLSVLELAAAVTESVGAPRDLVEFIRDRPGHVARHAVDSARIRRVAGWRPKRSVRTGIPQTVEWFRENTAWWRSVILGSARAYFRQRLPELTRLVSRLEA